MTAVAERPVTAPDDGKRMRARALECLRTGRVSVLVAEATWDGQSWAPSSRIRAHVTSGVPGRTPRVVLFVGGTWCCSCADARDGGPCKHKTAVGMVTGWPFNP